MRALLLCLVALPALAQHDDLSKVEIKATKVAGSVWLLEGAGGNIAASVGDDGIAIVDDQFAPLAPKIRAALGKLSPKPVRFLINTHVHGDHTGGNAAFADTAAILAHANVRKRLASGAKGTPMGEEIVAAVEKAKKAGKTLAQMQKEKLLAPWAPWGKGFLKEDDFLALVDQDLSKK
jgi:glyoxylase-like metal-dependent hydrolase (beta-lactamase superfamily II)